MSVKIHMDEDTVLISVPKRYFADETVEDAIRGLEMVVQVLEEYPDEEIAD